MYDGAYYADGFACPATPGGTVNGSVADDCIGVPGATASGGLYRIDVPWSFLRADRAGYTLDEPFGWSELAQFKFDPTYVDWTETGDSLQLHLGSATPVANDSSDNPPGDDENVGRAPNVAAMMVGLVVFVVAVGIRRLLPN